MVSKPGTEGGMQIISREARKTIQCLREVVGNHSDAEIYLALKESNMDPDEAVQKLLNQDPFLEMKRRKDRRKEPLSAGYKGSVDPRRHSENVNHRMNFCGLSDRNTKRLSYSRNNPGINQEFSVVRDNRVNCNICKEVKPSSIHCTTSTNHQLILNTSKKGSMAASGDQRSSDAGNFSQDLNVPSDSHAKYSGHVVLNGNDIKDTFVEKESMILSATMPAQALEPSNAQQNSETLITSSAVGTYSSPADTVHVPYSDSRSSGFDGAIRRDVWVVALQCQSSDNSVKQSYVPSSSYADSLVGKDSTSSDSRQSFGHILRNEQFSQSSANESLITVRPVSRSFSNNQYNIGPHQRLVGHHRGVASQPNKKWKPKSSQKSSSKSPGVIGVPRKVASPAENYPESDKAKVDDKQSQLNLYENQNVIIAQHICVPETDCCQLTFGTIGTEPNSSMHQSNFPLIGTTEKSNQETTRSFPVPVPESSSDNVSGNKQVDLQDGHSNNTRAKSAASEQQSPDNRESSSLQNLDNYADIGLLHDRSPSYEPLELLLLQQQQQYSHDMPRFSGYDPSSGYELPYFRPTIDEAVCGHSLPSPQEGLISHAANGITTSTVAIVQQQRPTVVEMHPQVHVPHLANVMPFRQYGSPVYVSSMAMPGYSSNVPYHHPPNASNYLLIPGGSSPRNANNLKYGVQQFKPVLAGNPTRYATNGPAGVGSATSLIDASRMKYKNSSLYVRNPQAETTEIWIQNPRELLSMQSTPFYNMTSQTPHAAYMPSNTGHFQSMYHLPPQLAAVASPHHLGRPVGSNVAAAAPGAQLGAHQQSQSVTSGKAITEAKLVSSHLPTKQF